MKIECILRRDPPAVVTLGSTAYQFKPDEQGRHVCEVEDTAHLARLLSISEAYRLPDDEPVPMELIPAIVEQTLPTAAAILAPVDENVIKTSTVHPATFDLGGEEPVTLEDVAAHALDLSTLTTAEWNGLPDEDRHNFIDLALEDLDESDTDDEDPDANNEPPANTAPPEVKPTPETASDSGAGNSNGAESNGGQGATGDEAGKNDAEREAAAVAYKEKFGVRPHYKWTIEKIAEEMAKPAGNEE